MSSCLAFYLDGINEGERIMKDHNILPLIQMHICMLLAGNVISASAQLWSHIRIRCNILSAAHSSCFLSVLNSTKTYLCPAVQVCLTAAKGTTTRSWGLPCDPDPRLPTSCSSPSPLCLCCRSHVRLIPLSDLHQKRDRAKLWERLASVPNVHWLKSSHFVEYQCWKCKVSI